MKRFFGGPIQADQKTKHGSAVAPKPENKCKVTQPFPQRQFIGDGPDTRRIIRGVIDGNLKKFNLSLTGFIRHK